MAGSPKGQAINKVVSKTGNIRTYICGLFLQAIAKVVSKAIDRAISEAQAAARAG